MIYILFNRENSTPPPRFLSPPPPLPSPKQQQKCTQRRRRRKHEGRPKQQNNIFRQESSEEESSVEFKTRNNREDQLFEVINELLKQKRSTRKRNKRVRLFDIIDNIPVSTDNDDSERDRMARVKSREPPDASTLDTMYNYSLTTFPKPITTQNRVLEKTFDPFPGPSDGKFNSKPINIQNEVSEKSNQFSFGPTRSNRKLNKEPSDSWVALLNSVNQNAKSSREIEAAISSDPDSWLNLKRGTRQECKETQTCKQKADSSHKNIEVQTEIEKMIEIPRTQTFFADEKDAVTVGKTKEFCDRVREEVIKKLEYQESLEDKHVQTICHAEVQTEQEASSSGGNHPEESTTPTPNVNNQVNYEKNALNAIKLKDFS